MITVHHLQVFVVITTRRRGGDGPETKEPNNENLLKKEKDKNVKVLVTFRTINRLSPENFV